MFKTNQTKSRRLLKQKVFDEYNICEQKVHKRNMIIAANLSHKARSIALLRKDFEEYSNQRQTGETEIDKSKDERRIENSNKIIVNTICKPNTSSAPINSIG